MADENNEDSKSDYKNSFGGDNDYYGTLILIDS